MHERIDDSKWRRYQPCFCLKAQQSFEAAHPRLTLFLVPQEGSQWGRRWLSGQRSCAGISLERSYPKILTKGYKSTQGASTSRESNACKLKCPCLQQAVLWLLTPGVEGRHPTHRVNGRKKKLGEQLDQNFFFHNWSAKWENEFSE